MQINAPGSTPMAATAKSNSTNTTSGASLADPNLFITLLTAQLQAQDPTNPMNPQDMVTQLTQVSSLQQLITINQTLQSISTGTVPTIATS